jgi:transposase
MTTRRRKKHRPEEISVKILATSGRSPLVPRRMVRGILPIPRAGAPWPDLSERFGPWQPGYDHVAKFRATGCVVGIDFLHQWISGAGTRCLAAGRVSGLSRGESHTRRSEPAGFR